MDLSDLKPKSDTIEVILVHPNTEEPLTFDDGTEFSIKLWASHTKDFKESQQKNVDKWLKYSQKKGVKKNPSLEEIEQATIEHFARITVDWDFLYNGEKPKLSVDKAIEIYTEIFWIRDQIQEALDEAVDFTKA